MQICRRADLKSPLTLIAVFCLGILIADLCFSVALHAAQLTLTWNRNQEPDIAGYRIVFGLKSNDYTNTITIYDSSNLPVNRNYTIYGLNEGVTYYFRLYAFDISGQLSRPSPEIFADTFSSDSLYSYDIFDTDLFISQQYSDFLNRAPDPSGLVFWRSMLDSYLLTRAGMVDRLMYSAELQDSTASLIRMYLAYFNRIPDYSGLNFWLAVYRSGYNLPAIGGLFAETQEFSRIYGVPDDSTFTFLAYRNIFEREPDAAGFDFWTNLLEYGLLSRSDMVLLFSSSHEFTEKTRNQVFVLQLYAGLLRRMPEQEELDYWMHLLDDGLPRDEVISIFLESTEYLDRFLVYQ